MFHMLGGLADRLPCEVGSTPTHTHSFGHIWGLNLQIKFRK